MAVRLVALGCGLGILALYLGASKIGALSTPLALAWGLWYRYRVVGRDTFDFNRAETRVSYWTLSNLQPGRFDKGRTGSLKEFELAQATVRILEMMAGFSTWEGAVRRSRLWSRLRHSISPDDRRRSVDGSELWPRGEYFPGFMRCQKTGYLCAGKLVKIFPVFQRFSPSRNPRHRTTGTVDFRRSRA